MNEDIFHRVQEILSPIANHDKGDIESGMSLTEDLRLYDTQLWEVQNGVENQFGFDVTLDDLENWKTVGDVVGYIESKM